MNKIKLILPFFIAPLIAVGQYDGLGDNEISRFRPGTMWFMTGFRPAIPEKVRKYDRLVFDITYNDWLGDRDPFKVRWNSIGFNSSWMFDIPIAKSNLVALGIGPSYSLQRFVHNEVVLNDSSLNYTQFSNQLNLSEDWQEGFNVHEFSLPVEIRFRTKGWKHFKFHVGGKIGYRTNIIRSTKFDNGSEKYEIRYRSLPDVSHLSYSAHARIGMRSWAFFASYNFSPLFASDQSIELYPIQLGLSVSLF